MKKDSKKAASVHQTPTDFSDLKFRALFENSGTSMVIVDQEGFFHLVNSKAARQFGYDVNEIVGKSLFDFLSDETAQKYLNRNRKLIESGDGEEYEDTFQLSTGQKTFLITDSVLKDRQGTGYALLSSSIDITERKHIEEALKTSEEIFNQFLENSPIYVFFKDENIRSLRLSRNFEQMLGKPLDELLGKSMNELFPSEVAKKMVKDDLQILIDGVKIEVEEKLNTSHFLTTKFPIQIEGKPNFLAGYTIDITEQKLAEQALKESEARLRELNATKDKFFSIIAHDLKSPFNSIIGFSNILAQQIQDKDYAAIEEYAVIIQNSSQQALDLLMNLLEWSQSQTGRIVFNPENINIVDLINQSTELFIALAQQKSITIISELPVNQPVFSDKSMINTILRNLISNAIKFTRTGGEIVISMEQMPDELVVSVSDNGVGIDKESISKLFRIDKSCSTLGTENEKGTGLGLLLCKEFVERHRGRIWAESESGKGSKFFFSIPNDISASSLL
jgi:PAS domain S-box-containing protein